MALVSRLPSRILLEELGYIDDEGDEKILLGRKGHIDDEGDCSNEVTTADLRGIKISFFAADPPHLSHFSIHGPGPTKNPPLRGRPRILHSVDSLALIGITSSAGGLDYVEYFIYRVVGRGRRPSLEHLEHISDRLHQVTAVSSVGILPLPCDGDGDFAVAALTLTGGYQYGLHVFRPEQGTWTSKLHLLEHDLVANIQPISIEKVIVLPTGEIGFVDLWKGILVFNILQGKLVSRFIPLPKLLSGNQSENQLGCSARAFRDVIISADSSIRCVEVEAVWQRILHEGPQVSVSSESPMDTEEVEKYGYLGWRVISWSRDLSAICWHKEFSFCAQDITPAALEESGAHVLTLQDLYVSFPTLSVDSSILYIFLKANMVDKEFRVAMVDMGNNSVTGFSPSLIERPLFSPSYIICDLFKYDLGNNGYAGEELDIESFAHDAADVDKGGNLSANNYPPPVHYRCSTLSCFCNSFQAPPQQSAPRFGTISWDEKYNMQEVGALSNMMFQGLPLVPLGALALDEKYNKKKELGASYMIFEGLRFGNLALDEKYKQEQEARSSSNIIFQVREERNHDAVVTPIQNMEMTFEEYEKVLEEKQKALLALKAEERKVEIDKVLQSMQRLSVKKDADEAFINLGPGTDLNKKENAERDKRAKKSLSLNQFLKPAEGERCYNPSGHGRDFGRGRGERRGFRGGYRGPAVAPAIEDQAQFPALVSV